MSRHRDHAVQVPVVETIFQTEQPVRVWASNATRLVARVYERDPALSRRLELLIRKLTSAAADLDCIGYGDPSAPSVGASTQTVVAYLNSRVPDLKRDLNQVFAQVDQVLGRREFLSIMGTDRI